MPFRLLIFLAVCLVAALFVGLALPLVRRAVPPNGLYGVRTRATLSDPAVWYEANALGGRDLLRLALLLPVTCGAFLLVPGLSEEVYVLGCTGLLLLGVVGLAVRGWRTGERLLAAHRRRVGDGE